MKVKRLFKQNGKEINETIKLKDKWQIFVSKVIFIFLKKNFFAKGEDFNFVTA